MRRRPGRDGCLMVRDSAGAGPDSMVAVLGAGAGSRMGGGKLGKDLGGRPLGQWALDAAVGMGAPVVWIAGADKPAWLEPVAPGVEVVPNPVAASGMATSLVLAAAIAMERRARRLLVVLADMPFVRAETLRELLERTGAGDVFACRYGDGRLGPPACFGAERLEAISGLAGDVGARHLLNQPGFARGIVVAEAALMDVDTDADLHQARSLQKQQAELDH